MGTALVAAATLGARCAYAGTLGEDELSAFAMRRMREKGIDVSPVETDAKARPVHSFIVVDRKSGGRNIFFDPSGLVERREFKVLEGAIRAARVLLVDHYDIGTHIQAVRVARKAGIPVVADFEEDKDPHFTELLESVDHLVLSLEFAKRLCLSRSPGAIARKLWIDGRKAVVITCGAEGCWFVTHENPAKSVHLPAFMVTAVDTTGCGDVFHGAYAAALSQGMNIAESLRFASAAAALKALSPAGRGFPTRLEINVLLQNNGSHHQ